MEAKPKILIVDDTPANLSVLNNLLVEAGFAVFFARDGETAIKRTALVSPDLILLDIMMPGMSGFEVCQALKADEATRDIPVIFMTALSDTGDKVRGFEAGAADYITKPFQQEEALARVHTHLKLFRIQRELREEKARAEKLLLNILPAAVAERLKQGESPLADAFPEATVLFCDIVNFTDFAAGIAATELVARLNEIFERFDALADHHGLEKIKTIGDAYMLAGGVPAPRPDHAQAVADMAVDMLAAAEALNREGRPRLHVRIGIHSGPVIAGVIGHRKFIYDLWGDTVNVASRMESRGLCNAIQISEATRTLLGEAYRLESRGAMRIKGKGSLQTYLLLGREDGITDFSARRILDPETGALARGAFLDLLELEAARCARGRERLSLATVLLRRDGGADEGQPGLLARLVAIARDALRETDQIARLGLDELAVLIGASAVLQAKEAMERLRSLVAPALPPGWTLAIGVAEAAECDYDPLHLLELAAERLVPGCE